MKLNNFPIGVFDSGLGGLTVVREIRKVLPNENIVYFGDTARVPYGTKSKKTIKEYSYENASFLMNHNVKIIVVACNTSTAIAIDYLRENFNVPIVGVVEPGSKKAVETSKNNNIGVIGTPATIESEAYTLNIQKLNPKVRVYSQACPLFVNLVEEGWIDKKVTDLVIDEYLRPLKLSNIDTLVLGCTHYPLLKPKILKYFQGKIKIIDSAESCSKKIYDILKNNNILNDISENGEFVCFVSDKPERFMDIGSTFLGEPVHAVKVV